MAALRMGCHMIEHGTYLDEEAADIMKVKGPTLVATRNVIEEAMKSLHRLNPQQREKMVRITGVHKKMYAMAVKNGVKIALGTDIVSSDPSYPTAHGKIGGELAYALQAGLTPLGVIGTATANGAETLGPQALRTSQIKIGFDSDLIALNKNPLQDMELFRMRRTSRMSGRRESY